MATRFTQLSPNCRLTYRAQGSTLREFHTQADIRNRVLIGPLASGKTQACIFEALHCIDNQTPDKNGVRRSRWVAARNTYVDLKTTTIKDWRAVTDTMPGCHFSNGAPPTWTADYYKPDGTHVIAEVMFIAFDIESDHKKARGLQLTGVWFNELKELHKANVDMLQGRVTRYPPKAEVPDAKFHLIGDSNAPDRDHWLAKLALEVKPDGWWFGIQPGGLLVESGNYVPNPAAENSQNLRGDYYTALAQGKKDSWVRCNLMNQFVFHADGRPVHPDFNEQLHVGECAASPGLPLEVGVDFGRTPAACIMQRQIDGSWELYHELTTVNTSAKRFGEILREFINDNYSAFVVNFTGDPAGDDMAQTRDESPLDMLLLSDIICVPAPTNDFEVRTTALDEQLTKLIKGQPGFKVHPRCTTFIRGMAGAYQFRRVAVAGADRFKDAPDKGPESHIVESCHYALLGAGAGAALFDQVAEQAWSGDTSTDARYFE